MPNRSLSRCQMCQNNSFEKPWVFILTKTCLFPVQFQLTCCRHYTSTLTTFPPDLRSQLRYHFPTE
jgi:hypothetical protein